MGLGSGMIVVWTRLMEVGEWMTDVVVGLMCVVVVLVRGVDEVICVWNGMVYLVEQLTGSELVGIGRREHGILSIPCWNCTWTFQKYTYDLYMKSVMVHQQRLIT